MPLSGPSQMNRMGRGITAGEVVVSRRELLATLTNKDGLNVLLVPANFPWLKTLVKVFERIRWHKCNLEYRATVGANTNGSVAVGVDWMSQSSTAVELDELWVVDPLTAIDKSAVLACTPSFDTPVWQGIRSMPIPASRLQSRLWYEITDNVPTTSLSDYAPGSIKYKSSYDSGGGEIWIDYTVRLSGTRA